MEGWSIILYYNNDRYEFKRNQNKKVNLKRLNSSQNITNEVKVSIIKTYGVTQDLDTKDYIIVFENECYCEKCGKEFTDINLKWCKTCQVNYLKNITIWTNENGKIKNLIREMQLKINKPYYIVFEWIPYNQFSNIEEIGTFVKVYSATWKDGPLHYDSDKYEYIRYQNEVVALKCLYDSQNITNVFLNEVRSSSINHYCNNSTTKIYGISQNPYTKNYILVFKYCENNDSNDNNENYENITIKDSYVLANWISENNVLTTVKILTNWISGNEQIDYLIQEMQLKINDLHNIVFEWIPYDEFNDIKKMDECNLSEIYLAIWKNGPLYYKNQIGFGKNIYTRNQNKEVVLKY